MRTHLKLESNSSWEAVYSYKSDYEEISIRFDKGMRQVHITRLEFIKESKEPWKPWESEWEKHSCKHGHWQSCPLCCFSQDDIDFISEKCKEHFNE